MKAEELIAKTPNLPIPSPSATRLLQLLAGDGRDNEEIIAILKQDGVLSTKVLALCNSAAFELAAPVSSISQAILYMGYEEVHRLVMAVTFGGALGSNLTGYFIEEGALWRHSLITALLAQTVVRTVPTGQTDPSVAYTAGLIHDIGKLVVSYALDEDKQELIRDLVERGGRSLLEAENEVIGADHAEVGACLLRKWKLPDVLVDAVANHHNPPVEPRLELSSIVHVADMIAHESGSSPGWSSYALRTNEAVVEAMGLTEEHVEVLIISAYDAALQIDEALSATA